MNVLELSEQEIVRRGSLEEMRKMGIDDELERRGVKNGDTVRLCDFEFEYFE